jgi:HTH-type transcriptional regulator / antitoxin MqsA
MTTRHPCMNCETGTMTEDVRDVVVEVNGLSRTVPHIRGMFCDTCDEIEFSDKDSAARYAEAMDALVAERKAAIGREVKSLRKKLKLTQRQASRIFGGGINAFSRYERGVVEPPRAVLTLLHVMERHPEVRDEICREQGLCG